MSLYIRLQNNFWTHRKTARLRALIGDAALWVVPRLWSYAAENQPDGHFEDYTAAEIAVLLAYPDDPDTLLQALLKAGFMDDKPLQIHDWNDHNSFHKAYSDRAKAAAAARKAKSNPPTPPLKGNDKIGEERIGYEVSNALPVVKQCLTRNADHFELATPTPPPLPASQPKTTRKPDPFPAVMVPVHTEDGGNVNHPDLMAIQKYFQSSQFNTARIKKAFLTFEASKDANGNWFWGKRMVGDWRAAMESRMNDDLDRDPNQNTSRTADSILLQDIKNA